MFIPHSGSSSLLLHILNIETKEREREREREFGGWQLVDFSPCTFSEHVSLHSRYYSWCSIGSPEYFMIILRFVAAARAREIKKEFLSLHFMYYPS